MCRVGLADEDAYEKRDSAEGIPVAFTFKGKYFGVCLKRQLRLSQGFAFWDILEEAETGAAPPPPRSLPGQGACPRASQQVGLGAEGRAARGEEHLRHWILPVKSKLDLNMFHKIAV